MYFTAKEIILLDNKSNTEDYIDFQEENNKNIDLDIINKNYINEIFYINSPYHELDNIKQYIESISNKIVKLLISKNINRNEIEKFLDKISGLCILCITLINYGINIFAVYSYIIKFILSIIFKDVYFFVFVCSTDTKLKYNNKIIIIIEPVYTDTDKRMSNAESDYFIKALNNIFSFYSGGDDKILFTDTLIQKSKYWINDNNISPVLIGNNGTLKDFLNNATNIHKFYILERYQYLEKLNILMDDIKFDKDKFIEYLKNNTNYDKIESGDNLCEGENEIDDDKLYANISIINDYIESLNTLSCLNNKLINVDFTSDDEFIKKYPLMVSINKITSNPEMKIDLFINEMIKLLEYINFEIKPKNGFIQKIENVKQNENSLSLQEMNLEEMNIPKGVYINFFDDLVTTKNRNEIYKIKDYIVDMIQYTKLPKKEFITTILKSKKIFTYKHYKVFTKGDDYDIILSYDDYIIKLQYNTKDNIFNSVQYKNK